MTSMTIVYSVIAAIASIGIVAVIAHDISAGRQSESRSRSMGETASGPARMLNVRLPVDLLEQLERLAAETGRPREWHVQEALRKHLDGLEDISIAERRYKGLQEGRSDTVTIDELWDEPETGQNPNQERK